MIVKPNNSKAKTRGIAIRFSKTHRINDIYIE